MKTVSEIYKDAAAREGLPIELLKQLRFFKQKKDRISRSGSKRAMVVSIVNASKTPISLNEILIQMYELHGLILDRRVTCVQVCNLVKLGRIRKAGRDSFASIEQVEQK